MNELITMIKLLTKNGFTKKDIQFLYPQIPAHVFNRAYNEVFNPKPKRIPHVIGAPIKPKISIAIIEDQEIPKWCEFCESYHT